MEMGQWGARGESGRLGERKEMMRRICFGIVLGDLSRGRDGVRNNHMYAIRADLYLDLTRILSIPSLK